MSTALPTLTAPTLVDRVVPRTTVTNIALIGAGVALMAAFAQFELRVGPVPITGQTLGVMLIGASLGAWRGASTMLAYMLAGLAGLPVFAGGAGTIAALASPSFGFVLGFIPAAALIGWLSERAWDRRPFLSLAGFALASVVPFLTGLPYLAAILGITDISTLLAVGLYPFLAGGVIKWLVAAAAIPALHRLVGRVDRGR